MHVGIYALSVFRFAKKESASWSTAAGMYVGHYMAWIAVAFLYAVYLKSSGARTIVFNGETLPVAFGPWTNNANGIFAIIAVVLASWTTASLIIDRVSLALKVIMPKASPFGAVIFFAYFFHRRARIIKSYPRIASIKFNKAVFFTWALSFGLFYFISLPFDVFLSLVTLPAWLLCGMLLLVFSRRDECW